jgi:hypothetical protein
VTRAAPPWLEDFQTRFGDVLRTPLARDTGTLSATPDRYDSETVAGTLDGVGTTSAERLAVYNRQYWFRLFGVLHGAFPLTCRLMGYWTFNGYAARYLLAHPPRGWDVDAVAEDFVTFFGREIDEPAVREREAYVEAAGIDAAYRDVFRAPPVTPFRPSAEDAAHLLDARLIESPAVAIIEEHSALLDLRRTLLNDASERRVPLPPPWPLPRSVALLRTEEGTGEMPLEAREAELLRLLRGHPVRDAVAILERACPPEDRAELPSKTRAWLARSVQHGWWTGMRIGP